MPDHLPRTQRDPLLSAMTYRALATALPPARALTGPGQAWALLDLHQVLTVIRFGPREPGHTWTAQDDALFRAARTEHAALWTACLDGLTPQARRDFQVLRTATILGVPLTARTALIGGLLCAAATVDSLYLSHLTQLPDLLTVLLGVSAFWPVQVRHARAVEGAHTRQDMHRT